MTLLVDLTLEAEADVEEIHAWYASMASDSATTSSVLRGAGY